jgi:hypothetical protein
MTDPQPSTVNSQTINHPRSQRPSVPESLSLCVLHRLSAFDFELKQCREEHETTDCPVLEQGAAVAGTDGAYS